MCGLIPDNKIAMGKLAQAIVYGAKIVAVQGSFDDALRIVRELFIQTLDNTGEFAEPIQN